jgi:hypothetical protein
LTKLNKLHINQINLLKIKLSKDYEKKYMSNLLYDPKGINLSYEINNLDIVKVKDPLEILSIENGIKMFFIKNENKNKKIITVLIDKNEIIEKDYRNNQIFIAIIVNFIYNICIYRIL